ncbi:hypothetical protein [Candidatus Protochlamydia phocaeensis]|uniref:hypothetical protein n=1 Tax=Candidatus Protochlamydia phocaeensis TaxID=1414722 RepID=UPI000838C21A|nr:hypothetical protein [Candidatus Protochlamydia phocaeensis]
MYSSNSYFKDFSFDQFQDKENFLVNNQKILNPETSVLPLPVQAIFIQRDRSPSYSSPLKFAKLTSEEKMRSRESEEESTLKLSREMKRSQKVAKRLFSGISDMEDLEEGGVLMKASSSREGLPVESEDGQAGDGFEGSLFSECSGEEQPVFKVNRRLFADISEDLFLEEEKAYWDPGFLSIQGSSSSQVEWAYSSKDIPALDTGLESELESEPVSESVLNQSLEDQEDFFTSHEPEQWFPLKIKKGRGGGEKIAIEIPANLKRVKRLIYVFRNKATDPETLLIGKTGSTFQSRMSRYATLINTGISKSFSEEEKEENKQFVQDIKNNLAQFEVGLLYALQPDEDLNAFESKFIEHKGAIHPLYNQRKGGAGGLARSEEKPTTYGIPQIGEPFTPPKRYPVRLDEEGRIRIQFTPGFDRYVKQLQDSMVDPEHQGWIYSYKKKGTSRHYCGGTGQRKPGNRGRQHCYAAEVFQSKNKKKYNPDKKDGIFHPALGTNPEEFEFNVLPIFYGNPEALSQSDSVEKTEYVFFSSLAAAEDFASQHKESYTKGFNKYKAGGGPIADRAKE